MNKKIAAVVAFEIAVCVAMVLVLLNYQKWQVGNGQPPRTQEQTDTVHDNPEAVALGNGWYAIKVENEQLVPSRGPCNGEQMCFLDRRGPFSPAPDGLYETFCVSVAPMAQKEYPLNYHSSLPSSIDLSELFGDYYTKLPGLIYVEQGPMYTFPTGHDRETTIEGDYMCFDFTGHHNGHYYFNFISQYANGLYLINENSPSECIPMMQKGSDYHGLCPVDRTDTDRFVWFHNDQVCENAAAGSLASRICSPRQDGNYMFGLRYQNTRGLGTIY